MALFHAQATRLTFKDYFNVNVIQYYAPERDPTRGCACSF